MIEEKYGLPAQITMDWAGNSEVTLTLRYALPWIWTQEQSRSFGLYWSQRFGIGRLYPDPSAEELRRFYDTESYDEYMAGASATTEVRQSVFDRFLTKIAWQRDRSDKPAGAFLLDHLTEGDAVCDIGCGSGDLLSELRHKVRSVSGVDPNPISLEALGAKGIEAFEGTAESLPEQILDRRFDLITLQQSLEHCHNPALALKNIRSISAEGAYCLIEVPNNSNFGFSKYGPAWFHTDAGRHLHFFTMEALCDLLRHCGFEPQHTGYIGYTQQFGSEWFRSMQLVWDCLYSDADHAPVQRPIQRDRVIDLCKSITLPVPETYEILRVFCRAV